MQPLIRIATFAAALFLGMGTTFAQQTAPPTRGDTHNDQGITREVGHQLALLPWYSVFDNLQYRVEGYQVTLMGQVVRPVTKDDAEAAVKKVEGVESVDNEIEVLPLSPSDDQLRRAEFRAIYGQPSLQRYAESAVQQIHMIVRNGHVTLEGTVASQADKDTANIYANQVPGVFSVTNNLQVAPGR